MYVLRFYSFLNEEQPITPSISKCTAQNIRSPLSVALDGAGRMMMSQGAYIVSCNYSILVEFSCQCRRKISIIFGALGMTGHCWTLVRTAGHWAVTPGSSYWAAGISRQWHNWASIGITRHWGPEGTGESGGSSGHLQAVGLPIGQWAPLLGINGQHAQRDTTVQWAEGITRQFWLGVDESVGESSIFIYIQ